MNTVEKIKEYKAVFCNKKFDICPTVRSAGLELLDIIDRQAKEIEQWELTNNALRKRNDKLQGKVNVLLFEYELLKQQIPMKQISDLQKENASLKEALREIAAFKSLTYKGNKLIELAEQALKDGE